MLKKYRYARKNCCNENRESWRIKKRTFLVNKVLLNKKYKKDIVDKKRIKVILKNIKIKSKRMGIDPIITKIIWNSMIKAYIDFEYRNFKK